MDTIINLYTIFKKEEILPTRLKTMNKNNNMPWSFTLVIHFQTLCRIFVYFLKYLNICLFFPKMFTFLNRESIYPHFLIRKRMLLYHKCLLQRCLPTIWIFWINPVVIGDPVAENIIFEAISRFIQVLFPQVISKLDWMLWHKLGKLHPLLIEMPLDLGVFVFNEVNDRCLGRRENYWVGLKALIENKIL